MISWSVHLKRAFTARKHSQTVTKAKEQHSSIRKSCAVTNLRDVRISLRWCLCNKSVYYYPCCLLALLNVWFMVSNAFLNLRVILLGWSSTSYLYVGMVVDGNDTSMAEVREIEFACWSFFRYRYRIYGITNRCYFPGLKNVLWQGPLRVLANKISWT